MFGIGHRSIQQEDAISGEQIKRLQALEASALWAHMQLSELLRTLSQPSPFELSPAVRRVELAEIALMDFARKTGLI